MTQEVFEMWIASGAGRASRAVLLSHRYDLWKILIGKDCEDGETRLNRGFFGSYMY